MCPGTAGLAVPDGWPTTTVVSSCFVVLLRGLLVSMDGWFCCTVLLWLLYVALRVF